MTLLLAAFAVHRITRLIVADSFPPVRKLRERLLSRWPSEDTVFTDEWVTHTTGEPETLGGAEVLFVDGAGWVARSPHWLGELVTCVWCASFWIASLAAVALWLSGAVELPIIGWLALPFAYSTVAGLIEAHS